MLTLLQNEEDLIDDKIDFKLDQDNNLICFTKSGLTCHANKVKALARKHVQNGSLSIEGELQALVAQEVEKYRYLQDKFLTRARNESTVHLYAFSGCEMGAAERLTDIHAMLLNIGKKPGSKTLFVSSTLQTSKSSGEVYEIGLDCFVGVISGFAPIAKSYEIDAASWAAMLRAFWVFV
jgi:hypothetical protein